MIKLRQSPINNAKFSAGVIDDDIVWLDVTMHDTIGVTVIQSLKQRMEATKTMNTRSDKEDALQSHPAIRTYDQYLVDVVPDIEIGQSWVQDFEVCVVDVLEDQTRRLGVWIPDDVQQFDDVGTPAQVLQDLNLTGFENEKQQQECWRKQRHYHLHKSGGVEVDV